jgi:hypothetical protein
MGKMRRNELEFQHFGVHNTFVLGPVMCKLRIKMCKSEGNPSNQKNKDQVNENNIL